jgi:hypothetical protein
MSKAANSKHGSIPAGASPQFKQLIHTSASSRNASTRGVPHTEPHTKPSNPSNGGV